MKKLLFLYNLHAGKGQARMKLPGILDALTQAGYLVTAYPTQGPGDAVQMAQRYGARYDRLVCCGGDGTLHEVVNGLMALPPEKRPVVGYLPAGTTNDFARNLDLPRGLENMARVAAAGCPRPCDVGRFQKDYFIYVAAFGLFSDVAYSTPQQSKNVLGHLAYVLKGVTELSSLKGYHLRVEHDKGVLEDDFVYGMFSNTVSVGGVIGLPKSEVALDDGLLEAVLVRMPKNPIEFQAAVRALVQQEYNESGGVMGLHSSKFTVTCEEPVPFTLDGEFGGEHTGVMIDDSPRAFTIVYGK